MSQTATEYPSPERFKELRKEETQLHIVRQRCRVRHPSNGPSAPTDVEARLCFADENCRKRYDCSGVTMIEPH